MGSQKRKRHAYDAGFKLRVAKYAAEQKNNSKAARKFGVSEKQVRDWCKNMAQLSDMPSKKKACRGLQFPYCALETNLSEWVLQQRQSGHTATRTAIRLRATQLFKADFPHFKASPGWCAGFVKRHNLTLHLSTKIAQRLSHSDDSNTAGDYFKDALTNGQAVRPLEAPDRDSAYNDLDIKIKQEITDSDGHDSDTLDDYFKDALTNDQAIRLLEEPDSDSDFGGFN